MQARLHEVERIANEDANCTGDIAGPEVCRHGDNGKGDSKLGVPMWRGTLAREAWRLVGHRASEHPRLDATIVAGSTDENSLL